MISPETTLQTLNQRLNTVKDLLARPDFNELKRKDPWEWQLRQLRKQVGQDYNAQNVTKAWLKFTEILYLTPVGQTLLNIPSEVIQVFFNAELPGGFVYALNHFLRTHGKRMEWVIASYLPQDPTGKSYLGDEFQLLQKYSQNSLVGKIVTNKGAFWSNGDLTNPKVPLILAQLARSKFPQGVDLYTADGGFNVEGRENEQEVLSLPLIRGEIDTGMRVLKVGGIFVLKIFTFFTSEMRSLLIYLMRRFNQYDIVKPGTSGPLNSEAYFIGIGFKGPTTQDLTAPPTPEENAFIFQKMNMLVNDQIRYINQFLASQPIPLLWNIKLESLNTENKL